MYCSNCQLHYAESRTAGVCPNCGRGGDTTVPVSVGPASLEARANDLTRTSVKVQKRLLSRTGAAADGTARSRAEPVGEDTWRAGDTVDGKYEVLSKVGDGGFGSVYKVRHLHRKKLYALKTPHREYLRDDAFRRRFEREIEALERFVHADMVTIRDSGVTTDGVPYYTMDFVEGESLKRVLAREGQLGLKRAVKICRSVLQVLEVAHRHQIIHRDIKPDNILLTRAGDREVVKVLDFGVAKLLDLVGKTATLTKGIRVGTPKYMSPEQITGEEIDGRGDIFAVGIVLYEAVTGRHPFAVDGDPIRTAAAIMSRETVAPHELRPEMPIALSEQILRMLEKRPQSRPQTARDACDGLPDLSTSSGRSTVVEVPIRVHEGAPRQRLTEVVLSRRTPAGVERSFLVLRPAVTIGRSASAESPNDLILRRLPCRSRTRDPENWHLNLTISQRVATIRTERATVIIEPWKASSGAVMVGGLRTREPVRIQSDRFHLSLGERALDIDGYRMLRNTRRTALDLSFLGGTAGGEIADGEPSAEHREGIGYSNPECLIDSIRLTRGNNYALHRYYLVYRRLTIGSGAGAGLRVEDGHGVRGQHATLIFEKGELFIVSSGGDVRVPGDPGNLGSGEVLGAKRVLVDRDVLYPLTPGSYFFLGDATFRVDETTADLFKSV